VAWSLK